MVDRRLGSLVAEGAFGRLRLISILFLATGASSGSNPASPSASAPFSQTDLVVGTGTQASSGNRVTVSYAGWLYDAARPDGKGAFFESQASYAFTAGR